MSQVHDSKASAQTARSVTNPNQPTAAKAAAQINHPASAEHYLIIDEDGLNQAATALRKAEEQNLTEARWTETFAACLKQAGSEVSSRQPFVLLRMEAKSDGLPQAIGLPDSIDWTLFEVVAQAIHAGKLQELPAELVHQECLRRLPEIQEEARHAAIHYMQEEAQQILTDLGQCARETSEELIDEAAAASDQPIPYDDYAILKALLGKATQEALFKGLNPYQLFVDDRLGPLLQGTEELKAFEDLPAAHREAMRAWIAYILGWTTCFPAKASKVEGKGR